jgi:hypothetical protein
MEVSMHWRLQYKEGIFKIAQIGIVMIISVIACSQSSENEWAAKEKRWEEDKRLLDKKIQDEKERLAFYNNIFDECNIKIDHFNKKQKNDSVSAVHEGKININRKILIGEKIGAKIYLSEVRVSSKMVASLGEKSVTVIIIYNRGNYVSGKYIISQKEGYTKFADVYVINWPEKELLGRFRLHAYPPEKIDWLARSEHRYGNIDKMISDWVEYHVR